MFIKDWSFLTSAISILPFESDLLKPAGWIVENKKPAGDSHAWVQRVTLMLQALWNFSVIMHVRSTYSGGTKDTLIKYVHCYGDYQYFLWKTWSENSELKLKLSGCLGSSVSRVSDSISARIVIPGLWDWAPRWAPHWVWSLLEILSPSAPPPLTLSL